MVFNQKLVDDFLDAIFPLPEEFGIVSMAEEGEEDYPVNFDALRQEIFDVDSSARVDWGMSKLVISSPNLNNIVIKIPFNGYYMQLVDESKEDPTYFHEWCEFEFATGSDCSDYCLSEYEKYQRLAVYSLDCFVAKTMFYKTIDGIRIFLQEEVIPFSDSADEYPASLMSKKIANKWHKDREFSGIDPDWIANCIDIYGISKVKRFLFYCKNIDLDILEDMHDSNFGYRKNSTPVILDYSNFCS